MNSISLSSIHSHWLATTLQTEWLLVIKNKKYEKLFFPIHLQMLNSFDKTVTKIQYKLR